MQKLQNELEKRGLTCEPIGNTLNVIGNKGIHANRVNVDPKHSLQMDAREHWFYTRGLYQVLSQPKKAIVKKWKFRLSAASLLPSVETLSFVKGVEDASGSPALFRPLFDDLVICYGVRWDRGIHIITRAQFQTWGVSEDRVYAGARSMLYHHSEHVKWTKSDEGLSQFQKGDGSDAARFMILEDMFYGDIEADFRFSIPSPDSLITNYSPSDRDKVALDQDAFEENRASYDHPLLCDAIFAFEKGKPVKAS